MSKAVALPVNAVIIMALGLVVVLSLAFFVSGGIFSSESELAKQQILSGCCTRACRNPNNFDTVGSAIMTSRNNLRSIVCATSSSPDWGVVEYLDQYDTDNTVTLWELGGGTNTMVNSELVSTINAIKSLCGC